MRQTAARAATLMKMAMESIAVKRTPWRWSIHWRSKSLAAALFFS